MIIWAKGQKLCFFLKHSQYAFSMFFKIWWTSKSHKNKHDKRYPYGSNLKSTLWFIGLHGVYSLNLKISLKFKLTQIDMIHTLLVWSCILKTIREDLSTDFCFCKMNWILIWFIFEILVDFIQLKTMTLRDRCCYIHLMKFSFLRWR